MMTMKDFGFGALMIGTFMLASPAEALLTLGDCGGFREVTRLPVITTWPDTNTLVYEAAYVVAPGVETVIRGTEPSARWWSYAIVDQARREADTISDFEILRDGSGSYELVIRLNCGGAPNCLDIGTNTGAIIPGRIFYRLYVPDGGETGGVALPSVTYRSTDAAEPDVTLPLEGDSCRAALAELTGPLHSGSSPQGDDAEEGALFTVLASKSGFESSVCEPGAPPVVNRSRGTGADQIDEGERAGAPPELADALRMVTGTGSFGSTESNAYASALYNPSLGNLELRSKAPSYRRQHPGEEVNDLWRAPADPGCPGADEHCEEPQTRYWSVCASQATRPTDCIRDENVVVDPDGFFRVVVSPTCPVAGYPDGNCLRGGITSAAGLGGAPFLLFRNTLVRSDFYNELGPNVCDANGDGVVDAGEAETVFCGDYRPAVRYVPRDCP